MFEALSAEPISLLVDCEDQEEVDELWEKIAADGGGPSQFGLSWQIIPTALMEMLPDEDPERSKRTREAMRQMSKIDIAALRRANDGR